MKTRKDQDKEAFKRATKAGCKPMWYDGILGHAWHCTCPDNAHCCDQQCSVLQQYFDIAREWRRKRVLA